MDTEFLDALAELGELSVRFRPKPQVQIDLCSRLARAFVGLSREERAEATASIAGTDLWKKLLAMSGYLAETAVNTDDAGLLITALVLHVIEGFEYDYRENFRYLVLIYNAAQEIGVEFGPLVARVATMGTDKAETQLRAFARRDPALNLLELFEIRADRSTGTFKFVPA